MLFAPRPFLLAAAVALAPLAHAQAPAFQGGLAREAALASPDPDTDNRFGTSIAADGDRVVIGEPTRDFAGPGNSDRGAATVMRYDGSAWVVETTLLATGGAGNEFFGTSVAISGDHIVVGATGDDQNGQNAGAAYVFQRSGGSWAQEAKLVMPGGAALDVAGASVDIDGDRLIVGAPRAEVGGRTDAGAAYIFERNSGAWQFAFKLVESVGASPDGLFGLSVAIDGDRALVGAPGADGFTTPLTGSAFVYLREQTARGGSVWNLEAEILAPPDAGGEDTYGTAVALDGGTALIGSPENGDGGAAYVFTRSGTDWTQDAKLLPTASLAGNGDAFGQAVALDAGRAAVGAPFQTGTVGPARTGTVTLFSARSGAWAQSETLGTFPAPADGDQFGAAVALAGARVFVGAPRDDEGSVQDRGTAYVFAGFQPVAGEDSALAPSALAAPRPNPTRGDAAMTLTLDAPQAVRATLHDALGRTVAVLFDGVAVGQTEIVADARGLAPGVYVVRVAGARLSETRRLTVAR